MSASLQQEIDRLVDLYGAVRVLDTISQNALNHSTMVASMQDPLTDTPLVKDLIHLSRTDALIVRNASDQIDNLACSLVAQYPNKTAQLPRTTRPEIPGA